MVTSERLLAGTELLAFIRRAICLEADSNVKREMRESPTTDAGEPPDYVKKDLIRVAFPAKQVAAAREFGQQSYFGAMPPQVVRRAGHKASVSELLVLGLATSGYTMPLVRLPFLKLA